MVTLGSMTQFFPIVTFSLMTALLPIFTVECILGAELDFTKPISLSNHSIVLIKENLGFSDINLLEESFVSKEITAELFEIGSIPFEKVKALEQTLSKLQTPLTSKSPSPENLKPNSLAIILIETLLFNLNIFIL
jgi:hypothetical protein